MTESLDQLSTVLGIYDEAEKLIDYAVAAAASIFVNLPEKRYVTAGQAVHDCEQVVFEMTALQTGLPAHVGRGGVAVSHCPAPWSLAGNLVIVRCGPALNNDGTVSSSVLDAFSKTLAVDALILQEAINQRVQEMFGQVMTTITFPPPSGGMISTSARIVAAVST